MQLSDLQKILSETDKNLDIKIVSDDFREVVYKIQSINLDKDFLKISVKPAPMYRRDGDGGVEL